MRMRTRNVSADVLEQVECMVLVRELGEAEREEEVKGTEDKVR
jgi:hypothetical protein